MACLLKLHALSLLNVLYNIGQTVVSSCIRVGDADIFEHYNNHFMAVSRHVLRGAEEACWAHNPKVLGSKPSGARHGVNLAQ